jgi:hypothetical protein
MNAFSSYCLSPHFTDYIINGDSLWVGWSKVRNNPAAHPASRTMGTVSLSQWYSGWGMALTIHLDLAMKLKEE